MHRLSKMALRYSILTFWIIMAAGPGIAAEPEAGVTWFPYQEGIQKIQSENKMGFLHFYTDWCKYCDMMAEQTFSDKAVIDYLNANFIPIRVDAEREKDVAREYSVNRFPSNWFLSGDGQVIANRPGFIPPDQMLLMLKYLRTGSYKTQTFSDFLEKQE